MSKMIFKRVLFGLLTMIVLIGFNSCHVHHTHRTAKSKPLPPGHAKKVTGSKSAKPYAPGQRKR